MNGRVALFHGPGNPFELAEVPVEEPGDGQILVKVRRCAICRSDVHTYEGRRTVVTPTVLGHEVVGTIEAMDGRAERLDLQGHPLQLGDRITWTLYSHCGDCFFCAHQVPQKCERLLKYGHEPWTAEHSLSGGFADYIVLESGTPVLRIPDLVSDEVATPLNCAVATAAAVLRQAGSAHLRDATVLIYGAGYVGLCACAMARSSGAANIIVCERNASCHQRARDFGANAVVYDEPNAVKEVVMESSGGRGADVTLELAGSENAVEQGLALLRIGGKIVLAGTVFPTRPIAVMPEKVVRNCLRVEGVHNYAPVDLETALAFLIGPGRSLPFESLMGPQFVLAEIEDAFISARSQPGVRIAIVPE